MSGTQRTQDLLEQMVAVIREANRDPVSVVVKRHGISKQTFYTWRKYSGGFRANDIRRLKQLEAKNARLKKLVAERDLEIEVTKEVAKKLVSVPTPSAASCVWPERGLSAELPGRKAASDAPVVERMKGPYRQFN